MHQKTLKSRKQSGENYKKTLHHIRIVNNKKISENIYKFIKWFVSVQKELVSGRNFSLINDKWGRKILNKNLKDDQIYKLRRYKNNL